MVGRKRIKGALKPQRVKVEIGTKDAYLWAPFGDHMKAGLASLLPVLLLNLIASAGYVGGNPSISERLLSAFNSTGQLVTTLGWVLIFFGALYCALWAAMSMWVVHLMRYRPSFFAHLASHALAGAVIVSILAVGILALGQRQELAGAPVWESELFMPLALGSLAVGAVGAGIGMWVLRGMLFWHITKEKEPLKDVFTFIEGHHAKDDFKRL